MALTEQQTTVLRAIDSALQLNPQAPVAVQDVSPEVDLAEADVAAAFRDLLFGGYVQQTDALAPIHPTPDLVLIQALTPKGQAAL